MTREAHRAAAAVSWSNGAGRARCGTSKDRFQKS
jgi:hypothetical protein